MGLAKCLHVAPGVTSVIGSGGKTTLLSTLADGLPGTVVLTTTTHVLPFPHVPTLAGDDVDDLRRALARSRVVCVGTPSGTGRLSAPALDPAQLATLADYVLVEADGSRRLPLKAHAAWEPVVPPGSTQTILVVGASGFGRPVREAVHRPERFCALAGCAPDDPATPGAVGRVISAEALADRVLVNQADLPGAPEAARELAALLDVPVCAASLREGWAVEP